MIIMKHIGNKVLLTLGLIFIIAISCKKDDNEKEIITYDYVAQEKIDRDLLENFLSTHYLDLNFDIRPIANNESPLIDQVSTKIVNITKDFTNDNVDGEVSIDYKLYYLVYEEGIGVNPIYTDSVNYTYRGELLNSSEFDRNDYGIWKGLPSISERGVREFLVNLKSGDWVANPDTSITYENTGKGYVFMPSGLGYGTSYSDVIPSNSPLIFEVELNLVKQDTDWDKDGILSRFEDVNNNGIFTDDDTDEDSYLNYYDPDDDGDGILTIDENPDPNGDGNPADAKDSDNDGTPDYLDPDTK